MWRLRIPLAVVLLIFITLQYYQLCNGLELFPVVHAGKNRNLCSDLSEKFLPPGILSGEDCVGGLLLAWDFAE